MRPSGIGGQAVIEGVMMKNKERYAIAVRKPDQDIAIEIKEYVALGERHKTLNLPIIRGVIAFFESMVIGIKTLTYSASFYEDEESEKSSKKVKTVKSEKKSGNKNKTEGKTEENWKDKLFMGVTVTFSVLFAVGLFMLLPYFVSQLLKDKIESTVVLALIEGAIRISLFVIYVTAISQMKDIKRVFMYHGAEHKTINCIENGLELTVKNVRRQSKQHKRCGTSFMLVVMLVSIVFFIFIRVDSPLLRVLIRLLLVPVIAGVSYEFIRFAGRSNSTVMNILSKPGMWLQGMTTKEPDDSMIEVAIASVDAVFDWREYLDDNRGKRRSRNARKQKQSNMPKKQDSSMIGELAAISEDLGPYKETDSGYKALVSDSITRISALEKTPVTGNSANEDEEDDEVLRALDKFFTNNEKEKRKA